MATEAKAPKATKNPKRIEQNAARSTALLNQLLAMFGAGDAMSRMFAARMDPTKPALINSQLQNYANMMSGAGPNMNSFLSGDFSSSAPNVPVTFGAGNGSPFDLAIQKPGVDPAIMSMYQNTIQPAIGNSVDWLSQAFSALGSPLYQYNRQAATQAYPYQPPQPQAPQQSPQQGMMPMQQPVAPANSMMQPPPAQQPGQPIPQYAVGTPYVPQTGLAVVHQGEQITPAPMNPAQGFAAQYNPGIQNHNAKGGGFNTVTPPRTQQLIQQPPMGQPQQPMPAQPPMPQPMGPTMSGPIAPITETMSTPPASSPVYGGSELPATQTGGASAPQTNPLQAAITSLMTQLGTGGPMNADFVNRRNQQIADQTSMAYQGRMNDMRSTLGARGLGGSGIQYGMENQLFSDALTNRVMGENQVALDAALGNWNALQSGAQNLGGLSLGAGQFGLNQQNQQFQQQMSMFQQLLQALGTSEPTLPVAA